MSFFFDVSFEVVFFGEGRIVGPLIFDICLLSCWLSRAGGGGDAWSLTPK